MRAGLGYDDVVNYQSGAYAVGTAAGTAVGVATVLVNPCAVGGLAGNAVRGLNAVNGVASAFDAGEAFGQGDAIAGMMALAGARASFSSMLKACFAAGTPVRTPGGSTPIEALVPGDLVLSRDEFDAAAPVLARRVLQAFARVSPVLEVLVEGRAVVTTGEHPFWVAGTGWTPAGALAAGGDTLVSHDGQELPVTAVRDAGRVESVYNVEVEHDHTYFVGTEEWGFSLWAHNADCIRTATGAILIIKRNAAWTAAQLTEAGRKLGAINRAGKQGLLSVNRNIVRSGGQKAFRKAHPAGAGQQADHIVELQLSGKDVAANLKYLNGPVNASLGASIKAAMAELQHGDKVLKVILR